MSRVIPAAVVTPVAAIPGLPIDVHAQEVEDEVVVIGQLEETTPLKLAQYGNGVEIITGEELRLGGFNGTPRTLHVSYRYGF